MAHFSRKCYSTVKQQLQHQAGFSPLTLSSMDTTFMATYAAGNIISGKLGDTFNPTTVLSIGLFGSGICLFLINIALWFNFEGMSVTLGNFFILAVYFLFGFFQSTGGPVSSKTAKETEWISSSFRILTSCFVSTICRLELPSWVTGFVMPLRSRTAVSFSVFGLATSTAVISLLLSVPLGFSGWAFLTGGLFSSLR